MKNRQKNLLKHANKAGHNAIVILDPENLFYMMDSGVRQSAY